MSDVRILPFTPERAADFDRINRAWIEAMFVVEEIDDRILKDPQTHIIAPGGDVLFAATDDLGVVGAGALKAAGGGAFELTKMGVEERARGRKIGEPLLKALIARAQDLGAGELYLLTNKKCGPAIHLYEKNGFQHSEEMMARYGGDYCRCDVAMRWTGRGISAD
ncbi:MAG: GNAT family N-acetyltransferase [Pseudomonadota bacterium]